MTGARIGDPGTTQRPRTRRPTTPRPTRAPVTRYPYTKSATYMTQSPPTTPPPSKDVRFDVVIQGQWSFRFFLAVLLLLLLFLLHLFLFLLLLLVTVLNRTRPIAPVHNEQTRELISAHRRHSNTHTKRPESPTVVLTRLPSKYEVQKAHQRYILCRVYEQSGESYRRPLRSLLLWLCEVF